MKVYIGPHTNWIGPFQIAEKILFWKDKHAYSKDFPYAEHPDRVAIDNLADFLDRIPGLTKFCVWLNDRKKRKVKIEIHGYDVWSADHTLALIIAPVLKKLKEQKHGSPYVDDKDVPKHLRREAAPALTEEERNTGHTDQLWEQRWEWVLDEIIWTFEQHSTDWESQYYSGDVDLVREEVEGTAYSKLVPGPNHTFKVDRKGTRAHAKRMANGRRLFAKYYESFWD